MTLRASFSMIYRNIRRSRQHFLFSSIGLIVGTATLTFFLALSSGIRERVLNRLYPVNQVEMQVEMVRLFGLGAYVPSRLNEATLTALRHLPGVQAVYPKQRSQFPARLWGGSSLIGEEGRLEAFFDGLPSDLIQEELRINETGVLGTELLDTMCGKDEDCGLSGLCAGGTCKRLTYWDLFKDMGQMLRCDGNAGCPNDEICQERVCRKMCGSKVCAETCRGDGECNPGELCTAHGGQRICERLRCRLSDARQQMIDDRDLLRGYVVPGTGGDATGLPARCPVGTYCAVENVLSLNGYCEAPIPVLVSPFLLDIYNGVAATALGLRRLSGMEVLLGTEFSMLYGESYFVADEQVDHRVVKRCRVVGFTNKAMEFGVTMPLPYAVRANAMLRGREQASQFTSVVVETVHNEDVPRVVDDARVLGLTLAPHSEEGRKVANLLLVLTIVFAMVSLIILIISAINIMHTFLMLVSERRSEIAVYRSVGARLRDIQGMILGEAAMLGLLGGCGGLLAGVLASRLANAVVLGVLAHVQGYPSDFFVYDWWVWLTGVGGGLLFAVAGAYLPSRAAARTDPATLLSQR